MELFELFMVFKKIMQLTNIFNQNTKKLVQF